MNKSTNAAAAFCLLNSASIYALGVGEIETSSSLNQALKATIPLVSSKDEDPSNIRIALASRDAFATAGIDRPHYLNDLEFTPVLGDDGEITINVKSKATIKEPFVNFILEVEWPEGQTLKEFTILLDPPITMSDVRTTPIEVATSPTPIAVETPTTNTESAPVTAYVAPANQSAPTSAYGPTKNNGTVWGIANDLLKNGNTATHQQMVMALYDNNPSAFYKKNINALKKGAILQVPDQNQVHALTPTQATNAYIDQNNLWSSSTTTNVPVAKAAVIKDEDIQQAAVTSDTQKKPEPDVNEAQLTLSTPSDEEINDISVEGNSTDTPVGSTDADTQANTAIEMATTIEEENKDVKSRLNDLEVQVQKLERLLALKDEQLSQLQAPKAAPEAAAKQPIPVAEKPPTRVVEEESNLTAYAGGGLLLALAGLFLARRRKNTPETEDTVTAIGPTIEPEVTEGAGDTSADPVAQEESSSTSPETVIEETTSVHPTPKSTAPSDPLAECDVFIAYGRYDQAEDLIQKSLSSEPDNVSFKLKLLDVYFAASKPAAFDELANELSNVDDVDTAGWEKVVEMGEQICPQSELFGGQPAQSPDTTTETNEDLPEFNFDATPDAPASDETQSDSSSPAEESEFEFDFALIKDNEADSESADNAETESPKTTNYESYNTNISLAQAYIDMGDNDAAREALEKAIGSGSDEDQEIAQKLLDTLKE